jgi:hypothetical protein
MKRIVTLMAIAMLVFSLSGQAMAFFEEGHLIQVIYESGGTKEIVTDLGAGWDLAGPTAAKHLLKNGYFDLSLLGATTWDNVFVAYLMRYVADGDVEAWTSGSADGQVGRGSAGNALLSKIGSLSGANMQSGSSQNVNLQSDQNSFASLFAGTTGSFAGFLTTNDGEASLSGPNGYADQWMYYYPSPTNARYTYTGERVFNIRTYADGTTEINAADGHPAPPQTGPISLDVPIEGQVVDASSLYNPVPFAWMSPEEFSRLEIQFSINNFASIAVKIKKRGYITETVIPLKLWKKILKLPGMNGGTVYWRVAGIKADGSAVYSSIFTFIVKSPEAVSSPQISHVNKTALQPPTLSWGNNNNVKFKVWFGNNPDFTISGIKKKALTFTIKKPILNDGSFVKVLTPGQWKAIRQVAGDTAGQTIYWYVETWDGINRHSRSEVMSFILGE